MRETTSDKQSPTLRKQTIPDLQRGQPHLQTGPGSPLGQPQGFLRRLQSAEQVAEASENSHREQTLLPGPHNSKAILSGASLTSAPAAPSPGSGREGEGGAQAVRPTDAIHSAELSLRRTRAAKAGRTDRWSLRTADGFQGNVSQRVLQNLAAAEGRPAGGEREPGRGWGSGRPLRSGVLGCLPRSPSTFLPPRASPTGTCLELPLRGDRPTFCSKGGARSKEPVRERGSGAPTGRPKWMKN